MYKCDLCNYLTDRSNDLLRHKQTKKHIRKIQENDKITMNDYKNNPSNHDRNDYQGDNKKSRKKNIKVIIESDSDTEAEVAKKSYKCDKCGRDFNHNQNLWRHKKYSCNGPVAENNTYVSKEEFNELKEQYKVLLEATKNNSQANVINADTMNVATKSAKKSMNMMSHAMKHFANAPPMKLLESKQALKLLTYDNKSKHSIEERMILHYDGNTLDSFLGDALIREYKMKNPENQSVWTTDTSRLCFIVKQLIAGDDDRWISDKSGIAITRLIISPLLKQVMEMLREHINRYSKEATADDFDMSRDKEVSSILLSSNEIIGIILKKELHKAVLKYIAPYFGFEVEL
jgi:hypothetical protein